MSYEWDNDMLRAVIFEDYEGPDWVCVDWEEEGGKHDCTNVYATFKAPDGRFWFGSYTCSYNEGILDYSISAGCEMEPHEKTVITYKRKESK